MKKAGFLVIVCILLMSCPQTFAQSKKVLFFESAIAPADTIFSNEPSGFSKLVAALTADGMLVASMSSGEISRNKLSPYEIVVVHASPERPLGEQEISALVWFVAQQGGALFVHGGGAEVVNPLTQIFGISMDRSYLVDTSSALEGGAGARSFALTMFSPSPASDFGFGQIKRIGFYGGAPLVLSADAVAVITGDEDCYSNNGFYSIGSFPPVAAVAYLGRGMILVKSDRTMLSNGRIEAEQNMDWAKLVFQGLASIRETGIEREESMLGLRARIADFSRTIKNQAEQQKKSEADLATHYEKIKRLDQDLEKSQLDNEELAKELGRLNDDNNKLVKRLKVYEDPATLKIAAAAGGILILVVFLIGLLVGRRSVRNRV